MAKISRSNRTTSTAKGAVKMAKGFAIQCEDGTALKTIYRSYGEARAAAVKRAAKNNREYGIMRTYTVARPGDKPAGHKLGRPAKTTGVRTGAVSSAFARYR